jgi:sugar (pentulose or hexulose) kinase
MTQKLRCVPDGAIITGWDFSTGSVKCVAFDLRGNAVASISMPTDLWFGTPNEQGRIADFGIVELNLMQLEGQARASVRAMAAELRRKKRLAHWVAGGVSGTHHTAGRIDKNCVQVRRAICWNDRTLADFRKLGEERLGGKDKVRQLIHGPWADRYTLSHLVKDEDPQFLSPESWKRTWRILPHGPLAAGYLTGNFDAISVSSAASTGMMNLKTNRWRYEMLGALKSAEYRKLVKKQLPKIVDHYQPLGVLAEHVALEAGIPAKQRPLVFPTSDDQQAGLVGGGAVDDGQMAIILGNSAVVNSSSNSPPAGDDLDVMKLNWGPYLWMRCYSNGAQFVDRVVGKQPHWTKEDWTGLETAAESCPPAAPGHEIFPFSEPEPSLGISREAAGVRWIASEPAEPGERYRSAMEGLAYLIALGVEAHERAAGRRIEDLSVSGGMARSDLMCRILASVLGRPLKRLTSAEGPALGAAVTALAACESHLRGRKRIKEPYCVADAVAQLVRFGKPVAPVDAWRGNYQRGLNEFRQRLPRSG